RSSAIARAALFRPGGSAALGGSGMARTAAILKALARALRRDQSSIKSIAGNNFFFVSALLLQNAGAFIYLIIGLVLLFPLSTDPLRKIPASRLALWPLGSRDRRLLRALSPWIN